MTEKLESNGQILNQTLRHISALEIALRRSQQKEPSNFSEDFYEQASNLANNTFVLSGVVTFMVFLKFKNLNAWLFLFTQSTEKFDLAFITLVVHNLKIFFRSLIPNNSCGMQKIKIIYLTRILWKTGS